MPAPCEPVTRTDNRLVERLLVERTTNLIGLARRGGTAVGGFERVREFLGGVKPSKDGRAILFVASDAQGSDRKRLASSEVEIAVSEALTAGELGYAFGRDTLVFAAIAPGALAREIEAEASRLSLLRTGEASPDSSDDGVKDASVR